MKRDLWGSQSPSSCYSQLFTMASDSIPLLGDSTTGARHFLCTFLKGSEPEDLVV